MERHSVHENPIGGQPANAHQSAPQGPLITQGPPQLPPQMFTTAAQLLDLTDSKSSPRRAHKSCRYQSEEDVFVIAPGADSSWIPPALPEKLVLVLRDGRKLIGVLRSWDQFGKDHHRILVVLRWCSTLNPNCLLVLANLVLQDTIERLYAGNLYADIPRGLFIVRGENVLLLGEIVRFVSLRL